MQQNNAYIYHNKGDFNMNSMMSRYPRLLTWHKRYWGKTYPLPQNIINMARSHEFPESFSVDYLGRIDP